MNIYEIDNKLNELIDEETGEIKDYDSFLNLKMERDKRIENTALWIKNLSCLAADIREEEKQLAERRKTHERKIELLKSYLCQALDGQRFETPKTAISFRKTSKVECDDNFIEWAKSNNCDLLTFPAPKENKTAIKEALKNGEELEFCRIVQNISTIIK